MPTGYTAAIADGISFEQFALRCARNFGALITMRDDPMDAEIPVFEPSKFYEDKAEKTKTAIIRLKDATIEEREAMMRAEFKERADREQKWDDERAALKVKYLAMLEKVRAWQSPTADHNGLKEFMVEQIIRSIEFDCYEKEPKAEEMPNVWVWYAHELERLNKELARLRREEEEEKMRVCERNRWVDALKKSLGIVEGNAANAAIA